MSPQQRRTTIAPAFILFCAGSLSLDAHQDPCHCQRSCPSDQGTSGCGDLGHCDHCPDTPYGQGGKPRVSPQQTPLPAQLPSAKVEEASCATVRCASRRARTVARG